MKKPQRLIAVILAGVLVWTPGFASADSSKHGKGKHKGSYEEKYDDGDCEYKYKSNAKGYKEKVKCRRGAHFAGGPPPWAPAHGYRAKRESKHLVRGPYVPPFDLSLGRCNRDVLGGVLGGAAGAAIGSQIGKGDTRTAAIIGGTVIGILVGGSIGRMMDEVDQNCIGQALEHAPDGQVIAWNEPQSGGQYRVVPVQTVQHTDGRYCREYTTTATVGGKTQEAFGMACRQPDGSWEIRK